MTATPSTQARKRGRPAKLSRDAILEAGLHLLKEGVTELSISSVARALKTTPMSLYTHVDNVDDLVNGVSDLALSRISFDIDSALLWEMQVRAWLEQLHTQFSQLPQLVSLLGQSGTFPAQWLGIHAVLFRILKGAGLANETLINTARWLAQSVISNILINHRGGEAIAVKNESEGIIKALNELEDADREIFLELIPSMTAENQSTFEFEVDRMIAALKELINGNKK